MQQPPRPPSRRRIRPVEAPLSPVQEEQGPPVPEKTPGFLWRKLNRTPAQEYRDQHYTAPLRPVKNPYNLGAPLTSVESNILQKAGIHFDRAESSGGESTIIAEELTAAARNSVSSSVYGLYQNRPQTPLHLLDLVSVVVGNLKDLKVNSHIIPRSEADIHTLISTLAQVEQIILGWHFEPEIKPQTHEDPFLQETELSITQLVNSLRNPFNLISPSYPHEISALKRLLNVRKYRQEHLNRVRRNI